MSNSEPTPGNLTLPLNIDHSVLGDALDQLLTYAEQAHAVFLDATRGWAQHGQLLTDTSQQRVPVSQVTWSVFGDLRHLRHAILHNGAVADARVARAESCQWFKEGDEIVIRRGHLVAIIAQVKQLRDRMKEIPDFIKHGSA